MPALRLAALALALSATGCITFPAPFGAGWHTVRVDCSDPCDPAIIADRYDRYPAEKKRVLYYHWMYNAPTPGIPMLGTPSAAPPVNMALTP